MQLLINQEAACKLLNERLLLQLLRYCTEKALACHVTACYPAYTSFPGLLYKPAIKKIRYSEKRFNDRVRPDIDDFTRHDGVVAIL